VERVDGEESHASANPPLLTNEELTMLLGETDPRSNGSNPR
jgi:hypothetical protein